MLFNTLAYAKFFGFVFVASWLLVRRQYALWIPGLALFAAVAFNDALNVLWQLWAVALATLAALCLWQLGSARWPTPLRDSNTPLAVSCGFSGLALAAGMQHATGSDLLSEAFAALRVPVPWVWQLAARAQGVVGTTLITGLAAAVVFWAILSAARPRLLVLLLASYVFYANWDYRFLFLIFASSSVDYWLGLKIGECLDPVAKKRWLWLTVVLNLGALAVFKYLDFGVSSASALLRSMGIDVQPGVLELALPVGISFFTFESMSYVIDVYRGELPPHRSYLEYLSFVAFFPHLVAGPIVRPRDLLPQLGGVPRFDAAAGSEALYLIAWGLLKKVAIADTLAVNLVDRVFDAPMNYSSLECYAAVVGYALQIYCDFSGYTDVAIGSALLLGVRFPLNFNSPYKAHNIQDFWRRWHISLSTWLRDYLYVPLGGNRKGNFRTYVNLMLTMLLGGLWHGANWTFVVWGGLHGAALAVQRAVSGRAGAPQQSQPLSLRRRVLGVLLTFHFVCLAWVFFRAESFSKAWALLVQLTHGTYYTTHLPLKVVVVLALGLLTHWLPERWFERCKAAFVHLPAPAQGVLLCLVAFALQRLATAEAVPFVYFQF